MKYLLYLMMILLLACSGSNPALDEIKWQINIDRAPNGYTREVLSLFLKVFDNDGIEDLEEAYLISSEDAISWWLSEDTWGVKEIDQNFYWLIYSNLEPQQGRRFSRGNYRVELFDHAGQKDTLSFNLILPSSDFDSLSQFDIRINNDNISVSPQPASLSVLGYDFGGSLLFNVPLSQVTNSQFLADYNELANLVLSYTEGAQRIRLGPYLAY